MLREDNGVRPGDSSDSDRKSTRLNSSHLVISYAVFCLKKKKISWSIYVCKRTRHQPASHTCRTSAPDTDPSRECTPAAAVHTRCRCGRRCHDVLPFPRS